MPNLTLSISQELHRRMKRHTDIRWSEVVRKSIAQRLRDLEAVDEIAKKSRLTPEDIRKIAGKINKEVYNKLNE